MILAAVINKVSSYGFITNNCTKSSDSNFTLNYFYNIVLFKIKNCLNNSNTVDISIKFVSDLD